MEQYTEHKYCLVLQGNAYDGNWKQEFYAEHDKMATAIARDKIEQSRIARCAMMATLWEGARWIASWQIESGVKLQPIAAERLRA